MARVDVPKLAHIYTEGDELPDIVGVWQDTDLTGFTVTFRMQRPGGSTALAVAATFIDAPQGKFAIKFGPSDLVAGLDQYAQIELADPLTKKMTSCMFLMDVNKRIL